MANLFLRSPRTFTGIGTTGWNSAKLTLTISGVTIYTLIKNRVTDAAVNFEVSELIRDYLSINYAGSVDAASQSIYVGVAVSIYEGLDGNAPFQGVSANNFLAIDAYGYFEEGANPTTTKGYMQSNDVIYNLKDADILIPVDVNNSTQWNSYLNGSQVEGAAINGNTQQCFEYLTLTGLADELRISTTLGEKIIKIETIEECRFKNHKISFVNRWGAVQDLYFFKKSIDKLSTSRESFKNSIVTVGGAYNVHKHPNKDFNVKSLKTITLNSGYVSEDYNDLMKELMQSEQVWMQVDNITTPMNVTDATLTFKTSVNDKLVDYKLDLRYAFDTINNMR